MPTPVAINGFESGEAWVAGSAEVVETQARSGLKALRCNPTGSGTGTGQVLGFPLTSGAPTAAAGFSVADAYATVHVYVVSRPASGGEPILALRNNTTAKISLRLNSTGTLSAYNAAGTLLATTTGTVPLNEWTQIGLRGGNGASADYAVTIGGVSELTGTADQGATAVTNAICGKFADIGGEGVDLYFDDAVICSDEFMPVSSRIGALPVEEQGFSTAWSGGFREVQSDDGDTSHIESTASAEFATFRLASPGSGSIRGTVDAFAMYTKVRGVSGTISFRYRLRKAASSTVRDTTSNDNPGTGAYVTRGQMRTSDPFLASAPWTLMELGNVHIGVRNNGTGTVRASYLIAEALYTPPTYTEITDLTGLQAMNDDLAGHYRLANDIDVSGSAALDSGAGFLPIGTLAAPFTGSLDGNGFALTGTLTINRSGTAEVGLFGACDGADIRDLTINDVSISGAGNTGAVAGRFINGTAYNVRVLDGLVTASASNSGGWCGSSLVSRGRTDHCSTEADVSGTVNVGGFIGNITHSDIEVRPQILNCYAKGTVTGSSQQVGGFVGVARAFFQWCAAYGNVSVTTSEGGGFIGEIEHGYIRDCYARGNVTAAGAAPEVGGFAGQIQTGSTLSQVARCYASGVVTAGGIDKGGFCGQWSGTNITQLDCYWDSSASLATDGTGSLGPPFVVGVTTAELKDIDTFANYEIVSGSDLSKTWGIDSGTDDGYPFIQSYAFESDTPILRIIRPATIVKARPATVAGEGTVE